MPKKITNPKSWEEIEAALDEVPEGEWIVVEGANAKFVYPPGQKPKKKIKVLKPLK